MQASSVVDRGFELLSQQTKDYEIGIFCISVKHAPLRRKSKDWLTRNQDNVSEWGDMFIRGLLLKINLFSPWYSLKIVELALNKNHSFLYWHVIYLPLVEVVTENYPVHLLCWTPKFSQLFHWKWQLIVWLVMNKLYLHVHYNYSEHVSDKIVNESLPVDVLVRFAIFVYDMGIQGLKLNEIVKHWSLITRMD